MNRLLQITSIILFVILVSTFASAGITVQVGWDGVKNAEALLKTDNTIVQVLEPDAEKVAEARKDLMKKGLYGRITVEQLDSKVLPYVDNLVNRVVVTRDTKHVTREEIERVLAPRGVILSNRKLQIANCKSDRQGDLFAYRKEVPESIDDWTHYLHDAGNNAVAKDEKVAPPRSIKWITGPLWLRSHETPSGFQSMVSGNGRIFYIHDEGLVGIIDERLPDRWSIYCRDAFNGKLLWKKPLGKWGWREWSESKWKGKDWLLIRGGRTSVPTDLQRRLVVDGDRLYATMSYNAPLSVLDAATGEIIKTVKGTEETREIFARDGIVYVRTSGGITALDAKEYSIKWQQKGAPGPLKTVVHGGKVFLAGKFTRALDAGTGKELWKSEPVTGGVSTPVAVENGLVIKGRDSLTSIDPETGKIRWARKIRPIGSMGEREDIFIIDGIVYPGLSQVDDEGKGLGHEHAFVFGYDLVTGEEKKKIFAKDLRSPEHHHRCYRNIATSRYIITSYEGAEFVGLKGDDHLQQNWVRGACKLGMVPANGMLYVPPDQCFCSPGAKILGLSALEGERKITPVPDDQRLTRGEAFGQVAGSKLQVAGTWPTFRAGAARHGSSDADVPVKLKEDWKVELGGDLTAPVAAADKVFVARKDNNTLYALDVKSGKEVWSYTARGVIDSPPTIHNGLVLFGSKDGRVHCLTADEGDVVWTFLAAPEDRRTCAFETIESLWPVHGSVLIMDNRAYVAAGRSSYFDGGVFLYALDPATGKIIHKGVVEGPFMKQGEREQAFYSRGANADILVAEGNYIYMRQRKLTKDLKVVDAEWLSNKGAEDVGLHVFSTSGLLDDSWYNRAFWMYSGRWPGFQLAYQSPKAGQLIVIDDEKTYAVKAFYQRNVHSGFFFPETKGYLLYADRNDNEPSILGEKPEMEKRIDWLPQSGYSYAKKGAKDPGINDKQFGWQYDKGIGYTRTKPAEWQEFIPIRIRAMAKAKENLFIAGPPDIYEAEDPYAAFEGRRGGKFASVSPKDGKVLNEIDLTSPPVFDGMAAAYGSVFMSLRDGSVMRLK